jgi:hypothetical protein
MAPLMPLPQENKIRASRRPQSGADQLGASRAMTLPITPERLRAYYHTTADTPDKLTYNAFARATEGLYGAFTALAAEAGPLGSCR